MIKGETKGTTGAYTAYIPPTRRTRDVAERDKFDAEEANNGSPVDTRATGSTSVGTTGLITRPISAREKAERQKLLKEEAARREQEAAEYYQQLNRQQLAQKEAERRKREYEQKLQRIHEARQQWAAEIAAEKNPVPAEAPVPEPVVETQQAHTEEPWLMAYDAFADRFPHTLRQLLDLLEVFKANRQLDATDTNVWCQLYVKYFGDKV